MTSLKSTGAATPRVVFTVSRLNQEVNTLLQQQFGMLWIEGELSNFSRPGSGHYYFSLKDSRSQLRCAMFRGRNRLIDFKPEDGQQVLIRGKLGIYEARGDFQFIAEHMELSGTGALQQQFEQTKARLQSAGWFNPEDKQDIPRWPRSIGIVTSPSGAAIHDILTVIERRFPCINIIIYPTQVQGVKAAPEICRAIKNANQRNEVETLIVARGGGSLEDLWAFNEESVAEQIHLSHIPVISGVGHEVDFTISDLVADARAATPSAAAEIAVPDRTIEAHKLQQITRQLERALAQHVLPLQTHLAQLLNRMQLRHPEQVITQQRLQVDEFDARLCRAMMAINSHRHALITNAFSRLQLHSPRAQIDRQGARLEAATLKLRAAVYRQLEKNRANLSSSSRALDAVSPLGTLSRGYAIVRKGSKVITDSAQLQVGDNIKGLLAKGEFTAKVTGNEFDSG